MWTPEKKSVCKGGFHSTKEVSKATSDGSFALTRLCFHSTKEVSKAPG